MILQLSPEHFTTILIERLKEEQKQIESVILENQQLRSEPDELKTIVSTLIANQSGQGNK